MKKTIMKAIDLSAIAYRDPENIDIDNFKWIENKKTDTQVLIHEDDDYTWVVFRGTEFNNFNDWVTNLDCRFTHGPWGPVHRGFWKDIESIELDVMAALTDNIITQKKIIFTGHSQGAADAELLFSERCHQLPSQAQNMMCIAIEPPRSMSIEAAVIFGDVYDHGKRIYHVINNNDIVTRVPARFMGYNHVKAINLNYLDEDGNLHHKISWWERFKDRIKGRIYDFGEHGTDGIKDHSITEIQRIWRNLLTDYFRTSKLL